MCWPTPQVVQRWPQESESCQIQVMLLHELFLLLFRLLQAYLRPGALHLGFPRALTVLWMMMDQNARSWRRGTNSSDIFRASKGPVKTHDQGGGGNNLHPLRACVSFPEKADGTKAFVTTTELVAARLQEERTFSTCSTLRGKLIYPPIWQRETKQPYCFLTVDLSCWKSSPLLLEMGDTHANGWKYLKYLKRALCSTEGCLEVFHLAFTFCLCPLHISRSDALIVPRCCRFGQCEWPPWHGIGRRGLIGRPSGGHRTILLRVVINKPLSPYQPGSRTILYDSLLPTDANGHIARHSANVNGVPMRRRMVSSRIASDYIAQSGHRIG